MCYSVNHQKKGKLKLLCDTTIHFKEWLKFLNIDRKIKNVTLRCVVQARIWSEQILLSWSEYTLVQPLWKTLHHYQLKLIMCIAYDPAILCLGIDSTKMCIIYSSKNSCKNVHSSTVWNNQNWKRPNVHQYLSNGIQWQRKYINS